MSLYMQMLKAKIGASLGESTSRRAQATWQVVGKTNMNTQQLLCTVRHMWLVGCNPGEGHQVPIGTHCNYL